MLQLARKNAYTNRYNNELKIIIIWMGREE